MTAYYNEIDPFAAQWLRELIKAGQIAPGDVDERSIEDVKPNELVGYAQCHFFAGIGVWSYALRQAGWPDDRPVWTGSCPCQPFSAAGKGGGFDDERHLWPSFAWLIQQCAPSVVFGEQVASKATGPWFDLVQTDVEAMGYAFGLAAFPSAGVGAPHIRDRAYWVADSDAYGLQAGGERSETARHGNSANANGGSFGVADAKRQGLQGVERERTTGEEREPSGHGAECGGASRLADTKLQQRPSATTSGNEATGRQQETAEASGLCSDNRAAPTNGFWRDADWLFCRDGKWRPVEPGTFPLANGTANRVGRLRGYGNAINAEAAKEFISAYMEA